MFNWLYKGIVHTILKEIRPELETYRKTIYNDVLVVIRAEFTPKSLGSLLQETLNDEEMQKYLIEFTDALYTRYAQKILGTIGGLQKGINAQESSGLADIIDSKGHFSLKKLIPHILANIKIGQGQTESGSGKSPYE